MRSVILCLALLLVSSPVVLSDDIPPINGARIMFDDVAAIYVKEHDGSWTVWIEGAPEVVNGQFMERYATRFLDGSPTATPMPTPTASPMPTPTPADGSEGLALEGTGPAEIPLTADPGALVCRVSLAGNVVGGNPQPWRVAFVARDSSTGAIREWKAWSGSAHSDWSSEIPSRFPQPERVTRPYQLNVEVAPRATWQVSCELPPRPPPEPTPTGFTLEGIGSTVVEVEAAGRLVCRSSVTRNESCGLFSCFSAFEVRITGEGVRASSGLAGYETYRKNVLRTHRARAEEYVAPPEVVFLGDGEGLTRRFRAPYRVEVYAMQSGEWTVSCEPVAPLPEARGFGMMGTSYQEVWGEDTLPIDHAHGQSDANCQPWPTGLLQCYASGYDIGRPHNPQWTIWGHDEDGNRVSYGGDRYRLRESARIWLGEARPGEHAALMPPYSLQVLTNGEWEIVCEPAS